MLYTLNLHNVICQLQLNNGEGNGNPFQYSCLENPMDGRAKQATVHGVAKSWTRLSDLTHTYTYLHKGGGDITWISTGQTTHYLGPWGPDLCPGELWRLGNLYMDF